MLRVGSRGEENKKEEERKGKVTKTKEKKTDIGRRPDGE